MYNATSSQYCHSGADSSPGFFVENLSPGHNPNVAEPTSIDIFTRYAMDVTTFSDPISAVKSLYNHATELSAMTDERQPLDVLTNFVVGIGNVRSRLKDLSCQYVADALDEYVSGKISVVEYEDSVHQVDAASAAFESLTAYLMEPEIHEHAFENGKDLLHFYGEIVPLSSHLHDEVSEIEYEHVRRNIALFSPEDIENDAFLRPEHRADLIDLVNTHAA